MKAMGCDGPRRAWSTGRGGTTIAVALGLLLTPAAAVVAQGARDVETGHRLAKRWCVNCHIVDPAQTGRPTSAPSFAAIARMPSTTGMSLHAFLQTPHPRMPDFILSRSEIDALSIYILSLKPERH